MTRRKHINERLKTNFYPQGNRIAGTGITEDRYDEESFPDPNPFNNHSTSFWHKPVKIEGGPVKTYKLTDEELQKYREKEAQMMKDKVKYFEKAKNTGHVGWTYIPRSWVEERPDIYLEDDNNFFRWVEEASDDEVKEDR